MNLNENTAPTYITEELRDRIITAALNAPTDPGTGRVDENSIKLSLANEGIFAECFRPDDDDPVEIVVEQLEAMRRALRSVAVNLTALTARNLPADFVQGYRDDMAAMAARSVSG